jgi:hypothetical protein
MLVLTNQWALIEWFNWLEEVAGLTLGRDYCWAWHNGSWAIDLYDPAVELLVLLKTTEHGLQVVKGNDDSSAV